eukprot:3094873-Rhodomonas_salina.3
MADSGVGKFENRRPAVRWMDILPSASMDGVVLVMLAVFARMALSLLRLAFVWSAPVLYPCTVTGRCMSELPDREPKMLGSADRAPDLERPRLKLLVGGSSRGGSAVNGTFDKLSCGTAFCQCRDRSVRECRSLRNDTC